MTKIKLIENAHIEGYKGAEYRYTTQEGKASWDPERDTDEENACEWDSPAEIISYSTGKPVEAEIEW